MQIMMESSWLIVVLNRFRYQKIITYYKGLVKEKLGGKQAILRKHCFGSRVHCSFRTVIVPHESPMRMDMVTLPWGVMVSTLKLQILNVLMNRMHKTFTESMRIYMKSLIIFLLLI